MLSKANEAPKEIILLGGVNANFIDSTHVKDVKSVLILFGMRQLTQKFTRKTNLTSTLIDSIGINNIATIRCKGYTHGIGDHDMVGFLRKINLVREAPRQIKCRNYHYYDLEKLKEDLRNSDWLRVLNCIRERSLGLHEGHTFWGFQRTRTKHTETSGRKSCSVAERRFQAIDE